MSSYSVPDLQRDLRTVERQIEEVTQKLGKLNASQRFEQEERLQQRLRHYETQRDQLRSRLSPAAHVE